MFMEPEGCGIRCLQPALDGQPFCPLHWQSHRRSLAELSRLRELSRDEYGSYACTSDKEDRLRFLRTYTLWLDQEISECAVHQRRYGCVGKS